MVSATPASLAGWSREGVDKAGRPFVLRVCGEGEGAAAESLYAAFQPKGCTQGLPPVDEHLRGEWLESLFARGINLLAFTGAQVVGHATLLDTGETGVGEYMVFVHPDHQNLGIGTAFTEAVTDLARCVGYGRIWLLVEARNRCAIHVYLKAGFRMEGPLTSEREMHLDLASGAP